MQVNVGMDGDIVVLGLSGDLVSSTAEELKSQVKKLIDKNFKYLLVEMNNVGFMDSSGLGACMAIHKMVKDASGAITFARPSEGVSKIFKVTRADKKLSVEENRNEGLKTLNEAMKNKRSA